MSLKVAGGTSANTFRDLIAARLPSPVAGPARVPLGILLGETVTPLDSLYSSLLEDSTLAANPDPFEVIFSAPDTSLTAAPGSSANQEIICSPESKEGTSKEPQLLSFQPIGYVDSCWPRKNGCPRQGILTPNSQATIKLIPPKIHGSSVSASDALDGIQCFSHVWLIFVFHANQEARESGIGDVGPGHIRPKVHPPRMGGKSIGVYATRSPHRFVPVGLTAAKLDKVLGDTLYVSGIDLIQGTPILDIKPYVPQYDSLPQATTSATWIEASSSIAQVIFTDTASANLLTLAPHSTMFSCDPEKIKLAIIESLLADPRSVYRKQKCIGEPFGFRLDVLSIQCQVDDDIATVLEIVLHSTTSETTND